jgi:hypothetical protein
MRQSRLRPRRRPWKHREIEPLAWARLLLRYENRRTKLRPHQCGWAELSVDALTERERTLIVAMLTSLNMLPWTNWTCKSCGHFNLITEHATHCGGCGAEHHWWQNVAKQAAGKSALLLCLLLLGACSSAPPCSPAACAAGDLAVMVPASPDDAVVRELRWQRRQHELEERRKWREQNL